MRKFFFAFSWFLVSIAAIFVGIAAYNFYDLGKAGDQELALISDTREGNSEKEQGQEITAVIETEDARTTLLANFLERYKSPMQPYDYYAAKIVEISDRYGLDFRLLPAIAMQESNLCKVTNPGAPHNCLGFGIHARGTLDFETYEAGFERAGRELKLYYIDQGLTTVELIESKYTPSSNGSWANSVNQWMAEIRYNDRQMGRENEDNASVVEFAVNIEDIPEEN
jgi:hypothetical protein